MNVQASQGIELSVGMNNTEYVNTTTISIDTKYFYMGDKYKDIYIQNCRFDTTGNPEILSQSSNMPFDTNI